MELSHLKWFFDMLVSSGCTEEQAGCAVAVIACFGVYIVGRFILRLLTGR